jgi:hypothetical protein
LASFSKPRVTEEQRLERELAEAETTGPRSLTPTAESGEVPEMPVAAE